MDWPAAEGIMASPVLAADLDFPCLLLSSLCTEWRPTVVLTQGNTRGLFLSTGAVDHEVNGSDMAHNG